MKLRVLGNTGPFPSAGGATSGFLLEEGNIKLILDMGSGTLANLLQVCKLEEITAVICSHLHGDHISDLLVLRYALESKGMKLPLYIPKHPTLEYEFLSAMNTFEVHPITEDLNLQFENLSCSFKELYHPYECFGIKINNGERTFAYTGDTALCPEINTFVQGVHALLCDVHGIEDLPSDKHLNIYEAIRLGNEAGIRHLILTHFNPAIRPQKYFDLANNMFKGRTTKAEILSTIVL